MKTLVIDALHQSWLAETSYDPSEWSVENPSRGQCVVSSLILQDYLGGDIRRAKTVFHDVPESHFYNVLRDGEIVDTTRTQYPPDTLLEEAPITLGDFNSVREMLLNDNDNAQKYKLLRELVQVALRHIEIRELAVS